MYRLYYIDKEDQKTGLMNQMTAQTTSLRQKLISLRQDEVSYNMAFKVISDLFSRLCETLWNLFTEPS